MKKSKLLLTLVVVLLLCSMLFALVACGDKKDDNKKPDDNKPAPEQPEDNDDKEPEADPAARNELFAAIKTAFKFDNTKLIGLDYAVEVPVANTADGKSRVIKINLKGLLGTSAADSAKSKMELSAYDCVAGTDSEVFVLQADAKDVLLKAGTVVRKFPGLDMGAMLNGAVLPDQDTVESTLGIMDMIQSFVFKNAANVTKAGDVITAKGDFGPIANLLNGIIGSIPGVKYIDIAQLLSDIKPIIVAEVKNGVITKFELSFDVSAVAGEKAGTVVGTLKIAPKFGNDVAPAFVAIDAKNAVETQILNFSLSGDFKFKNSKSALADETYKFDIKADIDVFCLIKNLVKYGTANVENIFADSNTKLNITVTDAKNAVLANVAMDKAVLGTSNLYVTFNGAKVLPAAFVDALFSADRAAALKADKLQTVEINPAALIADTNQNDSSNAPAVAAAGETAAPAVDATKVANAVAKVVSFLTAIDVNADSEAVFNLDLLDIALKAVDAAVPQGINIGGKNLYETVRLFAKDFAVATVRVNDNAKFFDVEAHKNITLPADVKTAIDAAKANATVEYKDAKFTSYNDEDGEYADTAKSVVLTANGKSNLDKDGNVVALAKADLEKLFDEGIALKGMKIGKVVGMDWNNTEYAQQVKIVFIKDVAVAGDVFTDAADYFPTYVVSAYVKLAA